MSKIKFKTDDLLPQLSQVVGVVNSKNSLPILNDVLFVTRIGNGADERRLSLTTSDSETWLTVYVQNAEFDTEMMFCVAATDIYKALANLKGKTVEITIDESEHTVTCEYGNGHFSLPYDDAGDFPRPNMNADQMVEKKIGSERLLHAIENVGFATANEELRPVMNGVHFDFLQKGMVTVATDGQKLAKYTDLTIQNPNEIASGFTLPKKPAHIMLSVLSNNQGDVDLKFNDKCVRFTHNAFCLTTRLIEGRYPNYDSVIPKDNEITTCINKASLVAALKRVMQMGNTNSELVCLAFTMGNLELSAEDFDFSKSARENVECDFASQEITIGFKSSVLLSILQNVDNEHVKVMLKEPSRAAIFKPATDAESYEYVSLAMPMLINS